MQSGIAYFVFLFNSDIRVAGRVPHLENGCCRSPQHTLSMMLSIGVKALLPSCIDVIKRNHWTGLENAIGQVGVPSNIHALLQQVALRVLVKKPVDLDGLSRAVPAAASLADGEPDDFEGSDEDRDNEADVDGTPVSIYCESQETQVKATHDWLMTGMMQDDVTIFATIHKYFLTLIKDDLHRGSRAWELEQQASALKGEVREYPLLATHDAAAEWAFIEKMTV